MKRITAGLAVFFLAAIGAATLEARQRPTAAPQAGDPARSLFLAGRNYWDDGHYPEAEKAFRELLSKYPASDQADRTGFYLIETLLKMRRTPEAMAEINKFFNSFPQSKWLTDVQEKRIGIMNGLPNWAGAPGAGGPPFGDFRGMPPAFYGNQNANAQIGLEQEVLRVLLKNDPERGLSVVRERLKSDPSDPVVLSNFNAITASASPQALPLMIAIARTSASIKARGRAVFWLGLARDTTVVKALAEIAKDDADQGVRHSAIQALSGRREPEALQAIEDFLKNPVKK